MNMGILKVASKQKRKILKITSRLIAIIMISMPILSMETVAFAADDYDYSNPIYSEGIDDTFVYDSNDSVITTKTGIKRNLPRVTGLYDISKYPIPLKNIVPDENTFELIKAENKEIMDSVEKDIENGTLTKHKAADGQFYGTVPDDALGVEKKIYINTNSKGAHSLASYVPAGEIATVKLNDEALSYAKKGKIKISVGMTMVNAEEYYYNRNIENRMPYLGKVFSISESETKVGTPFGGMVYIDIDDSVPSGLNLEVDIKGVVDTPYFDLGKTTNEEWKTSKNAPGIFAEIRTPYLRFLIPAKFIRDIDKPHEAALFWTNVVALSSDTMGQQYRTKPMSLTFDQYITAGIAYASVGAWTCNLPPDWGTNALDYDGIMKSGAWGIIHEINHHYQTRYSNYSDDWGVGKEFSEITNNALSAVSYILYTNIAQYRNESGTEDWNKVADPYSSLKQQIFEGDNYYQGEPNRGNFMFSTFAHEIGPVNFVKVVKSTYEGGTFNGVYIPAYDYKLESEGNKSRDDRFDDFAYRFCVASGRDYTWYIQNELLWPLKPETINEIKKLGYKEVIPVQSVYGMGEVGRETGRPFFVPSTGYVFDFEKSLVSPGDVSIVDISKPKYGTLTKRADGKYDYTPSSLMPENAKDEFVLTVKVKKDSIEHETKINCTIGVDYNSSNVEKFEITKWDIHEALEDLKTKTPYATSTSIGMKIYADEGNNLARAKGYFTVEEDGEYEFQAFGDDRAVFELNLEDGTTKQSLTEDYSPNADTAYNQANATHFTANLKANEPYSYTIITNNNGGIGWADVNIRKTSGDTKWRAITQVYSNLNDVGKTTDRSFEMPKPVYVRPPILASGNENLVNGISVISNPKGVDPNNPDSMHEADPNNMLDGDLNTYFHSSYSNDKTPFPHEYIFDLGGEKSFNNLEVYTRRTGDEVGIIGDYEIYIADEYDGSNTNWKKIAEDHTRKGDSKASNDLKISLPQTQANYIKITALNNRADYDLTILAEVKLSTKSNIKNTIAQNSSFIQYKGDWIKDSNGAFVNGATYNTTKGYFMYCFEGTESNIYVVKDTEVEMRINGGRWEKKKLTGSLREPSITLNMGSKGNHIVEVRAIGNEVALNMLSTDGTFYKGKAPGKSNPPVISGVTNVEMGIGEVDTFDIMSGITVSDDQDTLTLSDVKVSGIIEKPLPGENKTSQISYSLEDSDGNVTIVNREVVVTNQLPVILGLDEIIIKKGESFDLRDKVTANDYEDKIITNNIVYPSEDVSTLDFGTYDLKYSVTDSDGNTIEAVRVIKVLTNNSPIIIGANNLTLKVSEVDNFDKMDGISYSDDNDTELVINVSGDIGKPNPGTNKDYTLTYSVTDNDGNTTTVNRIITVTNQKPTINGLTDISIKKGNTTDLKEGISANDHEDGDLTSKVVVPTTDLSKLNVGVHKIKYQVTDSDKNTTEAERIVTVLASNPPVISGVDEVTVKVGEVDKFNLLNGITVTDDNDTGLIPTVTGKLEKPSAGTNKSFTITYTVTDSDGNTTTVDRVITVTNQIPVISGLTDITIKQGTTVDLKEGVTAKDHEDGDLTSEIVIPTTDLSKLDMGSHKVKYSVTDSDGNTTEMERILVIEKSEEETPGEGQKPEEEQTPEEEQKPEEEIPGDEEKITITFDENNPKDIEIFNLIVKGTTLQRISIDGIELKVVYLDENGNRIPKNGTEAYEVYVQGDKLIIPIETLKYIGLESKELNISATLSDGSTVSKILDLKVIDKSNGESSNGSADNNESNNGSEENNTSSGDLTVDTDDKVNSTNKLPETGSAISTGLIGVIVVCTGVLLRKKKRID